MNRIIIIKPLVTEKSAAENAKGKYAFVVHKQATKIDIMNAFESMYGVKAVKVNIIMSRVKTRATKHDKAAVKRPEFKKAVVHTKDAKIIDPTKFKDSKK